jgi:hypothetical protein
MRVTDAGKLSTNLDLTSGYEVQKSQRFGEIVSNFDRVLQLDGINHESQQRRHPQLMKLFWRLLHF